MQDRVPTKPNRYAVYDDAHNFLRYEYHERADEPTQVGDALNKANLLPDDVAAALGLTGNAQVKDALERLSNAVNPLQYVWNKYTKAYQEYRATATERTLSTTSSPTQYQMYDSVSVNPETGVISGVGSAYTWAGTDSYNCDATGKYLNGAGVWYFVVGMISLSGGNLIASSCSTITAIVQAKTFIEQLTSYSPTAYPQDGVLNDFYYKYIGRPQHIWSGSATGSYTGTGTYGGTSKNNLTFDFTPKKISIINSTGVVFGELIINGATVYGYSYSGSFAALTGSISGNTVSWYAADAAKQLNASGVAYLFVAEG